MSWLAAMTELWQQLDWRWPWAMLLALIPLLIAMFQRFLRQRALSYAEPHLRPWAVGALRMTHSHKLRFGLEAAGWVLLVIAMAGPRWPALQEVPETGLPQTRQGAHITVVVQVSDSMRATDLAPTRLIRARLALQDGAARLRGERLSLVAYGASAGVLLPFTDDRQLFAQALQWLDEDLLPSSGSNLGHALALALQQIKHAGGRHHTVLLISDAAAESLQGKAGQEVQAAIDALRLQGVPLYTWFALPSSGAAPEEGAEGMPGSGFAGQQPDREAYRRLSAITQGGTASLADGGFGWADIYTRGIGALPLTSTAVRKIQGWKELFIWPLGLGMLMLGLAYTHWPHWRRRSDQPHRPHRERRPKLWRRMFPSSGAGVGRLPLLAWLLATAVLLGGVLPISAFAQTPSPEEAERKAWQAYSRKQWPLARQLYERVGGYRGHAGAGLSALQAGRPADAAEQLGLAWMLAPGPEKQLDALYNLGHAYAVLGRWDAAAEAWRTVRDRRPSDNRAANNLKVALDELHRQRLAKGRPQDLYARRGKAAEGLIEPYGGKEPKDEPSAPTVGTQSGAVQAEPVPPQAGKAKEFTPPPFALTQNHLLSGQSKIENLAEQKTGLQKALVQQDAAVPPLQYSAGASAPKGAER